MLFLKENTYLIDGLETLQTDRELLTKALNYKLKGDYSIKYIKMLQFVYRALLLEMKGKVLESFHVSNVLSKYSSGVSHNTIRRHLNVLSMMQLYLE